MPGLRNFLRSFSDRFYEDSLDCIQNMFHWSVGLLVRLQKTYSILKCEDFMISIESSSLPIQIQCFVIFGLNHSYFIMLLFNMKTCIGFFLNLIFAILWEQNNNVWENLEFVRRTNFGLCRLYHIMCFCIFSLVFFTSPCVDL